MFFIGALFWPFTLLLALAFATLGIVLKPDPAKIGCFIAAGVLAVDCLLAPFADFWHGWTF